VAGRETREAYAKDFRLFLSFLWQRGKYWHEADPDDLLDWEAWRRAGKGVSWPVRRVALPCRRDNGPARLGSFPDAPPACGRPRACFPASGPSRMPSSLPASCVLAGQRADVPRMYLWLTFHGPRLASRGSRSERAGLMVRAGPRASGQGPG
jgi:hypothetical protein